MVSVSMTADTPSSGRVAVADGRYAPQGRLAAASLHQAVQDVRNRGEPPPTTAGNGGTSRVVRSQEVGPSAGDGCPMMCVTGRPYTASTRCGRSIFSQRDMPGGRLSA
jgi:hypothetical protein